MTENYVSMFTRIVPKPITSKEEHSRLLSEIDVLMSIPEEALTQDQSDMSLLLVILVQDYERQHVTMAMKVFENTKKNYHNAFKELVDI